MWKILQILTSDLSLRHYDLKQDFVVASDASDNSIGAVILHKFKHRNMKAIVHVSMTWLATEKKYSQIVKEALAIILAVKKIP